MQDCHMHTPLTLPARPAQSMVAVRDTPLLLSAYKIAQCKIATCTHTTHSSYKTCTKHGCRHTPLLLSAYKTRTKHGHQSETHVYIFTYLYL